MARIAEVSDTREGAGMISSMRKKRLGMGSAVKVLTVNEVAEYLQLSGVVDSTNGVDRKSPRKC